MERFEIKVPINNPAEKHEELVENETPTVLSVESIAVPAFRKEFRYSENICKETGIEGYEKIKITWKHLYDYMKSYVAEMPNIESESDGKEMIMNLSRVSYFGDQFLFLFREDHLNLASYNGDYSEFYLNSFKNSISEAIREIEKYSKIIDSNNSASAAMGELRELNDKLHNESNELLELRALCIKREELRRAKTYSAESAEVVSKINELVKVLPERVILKRIGLCIESLSMIIKPITEKTRNALLALLSTWSNGDFPKLTLNHVLSGDVESTEMRQHYRERLFKDDVFLQQIGKDGGSSFDLADGYLWDLQNPFISEPSFGFDPSDSTFVNIVKSLDQWSDIVEFIADPNVKHWLSQVDNPGHSTESGYKNWFKFSGFEGKKATNGHPRLNIPKDSEHILRWGHAKYAIIPTEKNFNLIKIKHKSETDSTTPM